MTLREKAALVLDNTHDPILAYRSRVIQVREIIAAWLDGSKKIKVSTIRVCIKYLQSVKR